MDNLQFIRKLYIWIYLLIPSDFMYRLRCRAKAASLAWLSRQLRVLAESS